MISCKSTENWKDHIAMLSTGIDGKIRFVFIMSPLMTKVATESNFIATMRYYRATQVAIVPWSEYTSYALRGCDNNNQYTYL